MLKSWRNRGIFVKEIKRYRARFPLSIGLETNHNSLLFVFFSLALSVIAVLIAEIIDRYTPSGYSVIVMVLLTTMLYTSVRLGLNAGLASAIVLVSYNFYLVSVVIGSPIFSLETLKSGGVLAIAFPLLAFVIGRLKDRIDTLLLNEQRARVKAEESANQLEFMATSMPQKIFTILPNGDTDYVNPQWDEYMGNRKSGKGEKNWGDIVHRSDHDENNQHWRHSFESGEPFQYEHRLKRKDGKYRWHLTRATALRDKRGKITLWVGSSTDIEDIRKTKKLEADTARLTKQRTQLMELNNAKDEFISLASHQLRTPATGVKQYLNMAIDGFSGPISPAVKNILIKANDSNERQLNIINDLLQVAQVDAGKVILRKETVNVSQLIASIIHEQKSMFTKRNQKVTFNKPKKTLTVSADITKLRMVLENIIDNAGKYSPSGTTIAIKATSSAGSVNIVIIDNGVGMAKKDIGKVFEKFVRLDNPLSKIVGGSGLGLYWGQKIIDLHGGEITVTSELNKGTTFTVSLPT